MSATERFIVSEEYLSMEKSLREILNQHSLKPYGCSCHKFHFPLAQRSSGKHQEEWKLFVGHLIFEMHEVLMRAAPRGGQREP